MPQTEFEPKSHKASGCKTTT